MFDQLFNCPTAITRHSSAPLLEQRLQFLRHCQTNGSPRSTLRRKARELLVIISELKLQSDGLIRVEDIERAAHEWAYRQPTHFKLRDAQKTKVHFISIAKQWLGFLNRLSPKSEPSYTRFINEFAIHMYRDRGLSDMTIRSECGHVKAFLSQYAADNDGLSSIAIKQIDDAIAQKGDHDGCTRSSIRFYAASLRAFFRYAETNGWCSPGFEVCGRCGGSVRVIACIEDQDIIDRILTHLRQKEQETPTRPLLVPPTRAPPGTLPLFAGRGAR